MLGRTATAAQRPLGPPTAGTRLRGVQLRHAVPAAVAAMLALFLAWHHPLSPLLALLGCVLLAALTAWRPLIGLGSVLALLPLLGLMPWSGWITFEEFDLAVLAVGAGGHARRALQADTPPPAGGTTALKSFAVACYALALLVSMGRGFADAGAFTFGWWQGYQEPMNSLRLAKSFFLALLLLPLWRASLRRESAAAAQALSTALAGGLALVALLALWERVAYTGLFDFSTDYRTTALFWEMHVGGAAFDGFLALTMPFAVRELLRARRPLPLVATALAVLLGAYACLTTFSRGVYIALPVGLALMAGLQAWQRRRAPAPSQFVAAPKSGAPAALAGWLLFALAAAWVFPSSGYRGLLALLGAVLLLLPMARWLRPLRRDGWVAGAVLGAIVALLLTGLAAIVPKGPYVAYAVAWLIAAAVLVALQRRPPLAGANGPAALIFAAFAGVLATMPQIAEHWGGHRAFDPMAGVALLLLALAVVGAGGPEPRWPASWRWQGRQAALFACTGVLAGVLFGGDYMDNRFASGSGDFAQRVLHWKRAYWLIGGPGDWLFGKGTGRYPANQFMSGQAEDQVGDYRLRHDGASHIVLAGGKHMLGWGELFRISQRIGDVNGPVRLAFQARTTTGAALQFEICRKHLLYDKGCTVTKVGIPARAGVWQPLQATLPATDLTRGAWYAPRFRVFSMAVESPGHSVEIDQLSAVDAGGRQLLVNGDFAAGMAHWFSSSDRFHLPWHLKSMPLHLLFEQGVVGALLFGALAIGALWRVTAGSAREHALAVPLAGALAGFAVVGLFDSLLDAPRVAFLFYLLVLVALALPARRDATVS